MKAWMHFAYEILKRAVIDLAAFLAVKLNKIIYERNKKKLEKYEKEIEEAIKNRDHAALADRLNKL